METPYHPSKSILFYDGICGLCNSVVQFVNRYDKSNKILFCPLQKIQGSHLNSSELKTIYYFKNNHLYQKSTALLHILLDLGFPFSIAFLFIILPNFIRDTCYLFISKIRYAVFEKKEACSLSNNNSTLLKKHKISEDTFSRACSAFESQSKPIFLKANWQHLIMINYEIDPKLLQKYSPNKVQLDEYKGKTYVSLVAFEFLKTRVYGIYIPFHVNFEEVNLRFYIKYKRGTQFVRAVVFVKEIVPRFAIAFLARFLYGEKYISLQMNHKTEDYGHEIKFSHTFGNKNSIVCLCKKEAFDLEKDSFEEFISEHYFGVVAKKDQTLEYEVKHPKWQFYKIESAKIDVQFDTLYGEEFAFLNQLKPHSQFVAIGSPVTVHKSSAL